MTPYQLELAISEAREKVRDAEGVSQAKQVAAAKAHLARLLSLKDVPNPDQKEMW